MSFVLPGCRSNFSLLWGTAFPHELIKEAERQELLHLGLADNDNLYGVMDFYRECRDRGINPLIGVRLSTILGNLHLIAKSHDGYQNLCRLVTARQLDGRVNIDTLNTYASHLHCLAPAEADFSQLWLVFGESLHMAVSGGENRAAGEIMRRFNIKPVADPSVSFINRREYKLHLLLRAIATGRLIDDMDGAIHDTPDAFFPDQHTMTARFRHLPEALANATILARECEVIFPHHRNLLPDFPADGDKAAMLRSKTLAGYGKKRGILPDRYRTRFDFELEVIGRTGFCDYFLIVSDIIDFCRSEGIPVVGRGSAAGSLVAYSLGITQVDPIAESLYFERFLNEARSDPPDIDLDIDWRRRDDVLDYIYERYGADRTAMIATYTRFRSRMAVREVAKAMGIPGDEISKFSKRLPAWGNPSEIVAAVAKLPQSVRRNIDLATYENIIKMAARLDNFPRHLGIHPGGIVITPGPLTDYVALERATKGLVVTQCDMYQAEKFGLVKIDVLGQRGFAVIVDCLEHARKIHGPDFEIPDNDPDTYRLLQSGKTIGVFQIESPGLRALLRDLKPEELNDITLTLALIRPGASDSGMKKVFLDRFHGEIDTEYPHQRLEGILRETFGVFIYQEQVLLCAREIAGFNLPAADLLRRAITKARHEADYKQLRDRFMHGAQKNGIPKDKVNEIFKLLRYFAGFGFCKAHAATYGYLAYQSAYLKTHFPHEFMTAVLNNGGGYYPSAVYIAEARRLGITVKPPDINRSEAKYNLENGVLYTGLNRVRDIEADVVEQIEAEKPFVSFDDFIGRVRLSATEMEYLIKVGAFDELEANRARLLWRLRLASVNKRRMPVGIAVGRGTPEDLFTGQLIVPRGKWLPELPPMTAFDRFCHERDILGFSASVHPLSLLPRYLDRPLPEKPVHGEKIELDGWMVNIKRIKTREKKEAMVFLTLEDIRDTFEVVLFPDMYREYAEMIRRYRYLHICGEINLDGGTMAIIAEALSPAPTGIEQKPYI